MNHWPIQSTSSSAYAVCQEPAGAVILGGDLLRALFPPLLEQNPEQDTLSLGAPGGRSSLSVVQGLPQAGPRLPSTTPALNNMFLALLLLLHTLLFFFFCQRAFGSLVCTPWCVAPV